MDELCGHNGPRGLRCGLSLGHDGRHRVIADEPSEPCEVCDAPAGEHCEDPRACQDVREGRKCRTEHCALMAGHGGECDARTEVERTFALLRLFDSGVPDDGLEVRMEAGAIRSMHAARVRS